MKRALFVILSIISFSLGFVCAAVVVSDPGEIITGHIAYADEPILRSPGFVPDDNWEKYEQRVKVTFTHKMKTRTEELVVVERELSDAYELGEKVSVYYDLIQNYTAIDDAPLC